MGYLLLNRIRKPTASVCLSLLSLFLDPFEGNAKTKSTVPQNPANPTRLPVGSIPNYVKPVRNGINQASALGAGFRIPQCPPYMEPLNNWTFTLSGSYQFTSDRSRIGGVSLNSQAAIVDLTANYNHWPWTGIDSAYIYSHATGTSPDGTNETGNQNVGE